MCDISFTIIGISDNNHLYFSPEIIDIITHGRVFSGGIRHHAIVKHLLPEDAVWIDVTVPLEAVFSRYAEFDNIVVFASGDPLFFG